jgi:hypothetical protein
MLTEIHQLLKNQSKNPENKFQCELGGLWEEKLQHVGNIFALFQSRYDFNEWQRYIFFPKKKLKIIEAKIKTSKTVNAVQYLDRFVDRWKPPDRRVQYIGNDLYVYTYSSASLIDLFKQLLSPDYTVPGPDDIKSIREHLECIWLYYRYFYPTMDFIPADVYSRLDFVMHKVVCQVLLPLEIKGFQELLEELKDQQRLNKSKKSMDEKKKYMAELIIKEFRELKDSTKKGSQRHIAKTILSKLDQKVGTGEIDPKNYGKKDNEKLTSEDTIIRRLKDNNLI